MPCSISYFRPSADARGATSSPASWTRLLWTRRPRRVRTRALPASFDAPGTSRPRGTDPLFLHAALTGDSPLVPSMPWPAKYPASWTRRPRRVRTRALPSSFDATGTSRPRGTRPLVPSFNTETRRHRGLCVSVPLCLRVEINHLAFPVTKSPRPLSSRRAQSFSRTICIAYIRR